MGKTCIRSLLSPCQRHSCAGMSRSGKGGSAGGHPAAMHPPNSPIAAFPPPLHLSLSLSFTCWRGLTCVPGRVTCCRSSKSAMLDISSVAASCGVSSMGSLAKRIRRLRSTP